MTSRVLMGNRAGSYGLFVSKPGFDVVTAGESGLLLSPDVPMFQIVESGSIEPGGAASVNFNITNLGFAPLILATRQRGIGNIIYNSITNITIGLPNGQTALDINWTTSGKPTLSDTLFYAVTNIPAF